MLTTRRGVLDIILCDFRDLFDATEVAEGRETIQVDTHINIPEALHSQKLQMLRTVHLNGHV